MQVFWCHVVLCISCHFMRVTRKLFPRRFALLLAAPNPGDATVKGPFARELGTGGEEMRPLD